MTKHPGPEAARVVIDLKRHVKRVAAMMAAGEWEEVLASLDEAKAAAQRLERYQRTGTLERRGWGS